MRIAQLVTNVERTPPERYGGTELVAHLLSEELINRGHEVTLFATGDSATSGRLVSVTETPLRLDARYNMTQWAAFDIRLLDKLEEMQGQFDLIHNHMGWQALSMLSRLRCPAISTNHNLIKPYNQDIYLKHRRLPYVAISQAYKELNYPDQLNYVGVVYNGIKTDDFSADLDGERQYLLFIGRLCHDKGTADALDIARRLKMPIKLAGKVDKNDQHYFETEIKPRLAQSGDASIEYVGEVNHQEKVQLYKKAIAVVYPIAFAEPFGLVMAEALASGTPVLAYDRGSVREILSDGETAVIGNSIDELVSRFPEILKLDRKACIERARTKFGVKQMVDAYLSLYERIAVGATASA